MRALANGRRLSRLFESPVLLNSDRVLLPREAPIPLLQWRSKSSFLFHSPAHSFSGNGSEIGNLSMYMRNFPQANFSSKASNVEEGNPTEAVKEIYDKIMESVLVKRSMSPNSWLWSFIEKCKNNDDIKLLFDALEKLRRFRLSNLRISSNFNLSLCQEVAKACVRVGSIDYGKKVLQKHNVHGLTPTIFSANELLRYAQEHNDAKLMVEIMELIKKNGLPLQPSTADLVFSICYNTDNWELLKKYSKKFVLGGVKLRKTALDAWHEFATRVGDAEPISRIEKMRLASVKHEFRAELNPE